MDFGKSIERYVQFFETLSPESVQDLRGLVTPDVHFRDPFNDFRDAGLMVQVMEDSFAQAIDPSFDIVGIYPKGRTALLRWEMSFTPKRFPRSGKWEVPGVTEIHFDDSGLVMAHLDYWDAASYFYERLPLLGGLIRAVKKRLKV